MISVCQTAAKWPRAMNNQHDPVFQEWALTEQLQQLPAALLFGVDALEQVMTQIFRMVIISINMCKILWLKAWSSETACTRRLTHMSFEGGCLFFTD